MMVKQYRYIILAALSFIYFTAGAQSTAGITNKPDTSYTTYSAFNSAKKTHPHISIVEEFHSAYIKQKRSITYCKTGKRKLQLDTFYPTTKTKQKRAAIMIIHGGG